MTSYGSFRLQILILTLTHHVSRAIAETIDCGSLLALDGRGRDGGPWVFDSVKVLGYDVLTPDKVGVPDANMTVALVTCRLAGFVFGVEGPVFVNQIVSWCNDSADEPEWFPFAPMEATCLPGGAKKMLLRRGDGVELGFETLLDWKLAVLDMRPALTFDEETWQLLEPAPYVVFQTLQEMAEEYNAERNDVNRTRRVVKIVPDYENKWKYFPAAIGCFSVVGGCILLSCIAETSFCRIRKLDPEYA